MSASGGAPPSSGSRYPWPFRRRRRRSRPRTRKLELDHIVMDNEGKKYQVTSLARKRNPRGKITYKWRVTLVSLDGDILRGTLPKITGPLKLERRGSQPMNLTNLGPSNPQVGSFGSFNYQFGDWGLPFDLPWGRCSDLEEKFYSRWLEKDTEQNRAIKEKFIRRGQDENCAWSDDLIDDIEEVCPYCGLDVSEYFEDDDDDDDED